MNTFNTQMLYIAEARALLNSKESPVVQGALRHRQSIYGEHSFRSKLDASDDLACALYAAMKTRGAGRVDSVHAMAVGLVCDMNSLESKLGWHDAKLRWKYGQKTVPLLGVIDTELNGRWSEIGADQIERLVDAICDDRELKLQRKSELQKSFDDVKEPNRWGRLMDFFSRVMKVSRDEKVVSASPSASVNG